MAKIFSFVILMICFMLLVRGQRIFNINRSRRRGHSPAGKATMFHVRDLIIKGERDHAIQMYSEIFSVTRAEAETAVSELEAGMQGKNYS